MLESKNFISLDHVLIRKILSLIESNVDKICLLLTCKYLFNNFSTLFIPNRTQFTPTSLKHLILCKDIIIEINNQLISNKQQQSKKQFITLTEFKSLEISLINTKENVNNSKRIFIKDIKEKIAQTKCDKIMINKNLPNKNDIEILKDFDYITQLEINAKYTHPIMHDQLSNNIKSLTLNCNIMIHPYGLPASIEQLVLGEKYTHSLADGTLPSNLKKLEVHSPIPIIANCQLPNSLHHLIFTSVFASYTIKRDYLPRQLQHLVAGPSMKFEAGAIPQSVTRFTTSDHYSIEIFENPNTLHHLIFSHNYNSRFLTLDHHNSNPNGSLLPLCLESLEFGYTYNHIISPNTIPSTIKRLVFTGMYDQFLRPFVLPQSIVDIEFGPFYNKPLLGFNALPSSLKKLKFGSHFNQPILPEILPDTLEYLEFGENFNQILEPGSIPPTVETLVLGGHTERIRDGVIPNSVNKLIMRCEFSNYTELTEYITHIAQHMSLNKPLSWIIDSKNHSLDLRVISRHSLLAIAENLNFGAFINITPNDLD